MTWLSGGSGESPVPLGNSEPCRRSGGFLAIAQEPSERQFRLGVDAFLLPDHLAQIVIESLGFDARGHCRIGLDRVCPYPVRWVPAVARLLQPVDDGLARLVLWAAFAKLDCHLAV